MGPTRSRSRDAGIEEAQIDAIHRGNRSRAMNFTATDSHGPGPSIPTEQHSRRTSQSNERQDQRTTTHNVPQFSITPPTPSEWKQWKADEPFRTKIPESKLKKEDWVKAMEASDDGMCKGWRDEIDTLIVFAGLFSATVTVFTVESYQWLSETPADTLARLQLRDLLNTTHNPAIDLLAPATFNVSSASVAINTLWFASLTLSLAAVSISILCKQWLYEYQRYENLTTDEALLIRGLRYRGLQAWGVPNIISWPAAFLQFALTLFLAGIVILLCPLQIVVGSITATIVSLIYLFLSVTTVLPSFQYIFPIFKTQCPYKSSLSWSYLITTFWLFDFRRFTNWASFDRWEVTNVYSDMGRTLLRIYIVLGDNIDAKLGLYSFLAEKSLKPTVLADLALVSDIVDELDAAPRKSMQQELESLTETLKEHQRLKQLKNIVRRHNNPFKRQPIKRGIPQDDWFPSKSTNQIEHDIDRAYHWKMQLVLGKLLRAQNGLDDPIIFNRYVEHCIRALDGGNGLAMIKLPTDIYYNHNPYHPETAGHLVRLVSHGLRVEHPQTFDRTSLISGPYSKLMESYQLQEFSPSPLTLLNDIEDWISRVPESDLDKKAFFAEQILLDLAFEPIFKRFIDAHSSDIEKQCLISFMHFFVALYEREDFSWAVRRAFHKKETYQALTFFNDYLAENAVVPS